jgi:hypothetical protein
VDALAPHVREAKYAVCLGSNPRDYTNKEKLLKVGSCRSLAHQDFVICGADGALIGLCRPLITF